MRRSVLAHSSDLGIYGEALSSDIHPGYIMCTQSLKCYTDFLHPAPYFHVNWCAENCVQNPQYRTLAKKMCLPQIILLN